MSGYLDAAAGLPLHPAARSALHAALDDGWADPSKLYAAGRRARQLLDGAREALAELVGARPDEVDVTSSGTTARHLGVLGAAGGRIRTGTHLVHTAVDHSDVLHAVAFAGGPATSVPVDRLGRVDVAAYEEALRPDTALACLMSASHEVGTVQPVEQVADLCGNVPLLLDAAPSIGRIPVPDGWSVLTADARLWGGPMLGVLAVRTGTRWRSPVPGEARVPGPVDLPAALSAAVGLQAVLAESVAEAARLRVLTDRLRAGLAGTRDLEVVGDPVDRLPHLVAFSSPYLDGETLLRGLDREGFAVSSGSSCSASVLEPSHVLAAMGLLPGGSVRLSLHRETTADDVERLLAVLPQLIAEQQV